MRYEDVVALLAYARQLVGGIDDDEVTVELWADMLRGLDADLDTARAAVRTAADRGGISAARVREALLPLTQTPGRRYGTALVPASPYESDYQRRQRGRRGIEKVRDALAQDPLPIEADQERPRPAADDHRTDPDTGGVDQ